MAMLSTLYSQLILNNRFKIIHCTATKYNGNFSKNASIWQKEILWKVLTNTFCTATYWYLGSFQLWLPKKPDVSTTAPVPDQRWTTPSLLRSPRTPTQGSANMTKCRLLRARRPGPAPTPAPEPAPTSTRPLWTPSPSPLDPSLLESLLLPRAPQPLALDSSLLPSQPSKALEPRLLLPPGLLPPSQVPRPTWEVGRENEPPESGEFYFRGF